MVTFASLDRTVSDFSERSDRVRQDLYYCDVSFADRASRPTRQAVHSGSYVLLAAALEATVKGLLTATLDEINAQALPRSQLRLTLFALEQNSILDSLQDVRGMKMWAKRADLFSALDNAEVCDLPVASLPMDGRTVRPNHFDTIWQVFGLDGDPTPSPRHRLALTDLADARNDLAHGERSPNEIAGRKTVDDTIRLLGTVEEVVLHLWGALTDYLTASAYCR